MPADRSTDTASARELSADLYRVLAVTVVVIGHWLVSAVTFRDGQFGNDYPLDVMPWTRWLTLVFQVVPVFFLVGGYASAASWTRWREAGGRHWTEWVRHRLAAILGPTTAYVVLALAAVAVLDWVGVGRSPLRFGGWAVAMHLWFVPVYLAAADADTRRGGGTPAMGAAGAGRPGACCCGRRRCGACLASADNQLSQLPTVLGSDLSGRDLLARWGFGRPPAGADRRRGRHRARDAARPALLPDQHGRIARRDRAEQLSAHRGVACIRRGTSCGSWSQRRPR